ncbi:MAG: enoyl-CoA hydratase-related protein [Prolixibacteraceae bacterium]|nr:enoyl-CoA hydratase-related protein [Prolixibacteraceae bacterium]
MDNYQTIRTELNGANLTLWLSRPEVHNALNHLMIREISHLFSELEKMSNIRVVIIRGHGKSFCSGADLQWMKNAFALSNAENLKESEELSGMFSTIFQSSKIVVGVVHGNVFGGGNGLVAVCDLAIGLSDSRFSFSETKIGMVAATITPYLLQKIKISDLKELIFSARSFDGDEAVKYGLLNHSFSSPESLDHFLNNLLTLTESNGREAIAASKQLINRLTLQSMQETMENIPGILAQIRVSPEAQEGFSAFLEKRKPNW